MEIILILLVAGGSFGFCFLVDKAFTKLFRSKAQHQSGQSIRQNKHYAGAGLVLIVLGISAVLAGLKGNTLLLAGGAVLILVGIALVVYYMSFGVFYDESSFLYTTFGKKTVEYRYGDIIAQQLYTSYGNTLIELHMRDGKTVPLQANMAGVYAFLDTAFAGWLTQTGRNENDCPFHDPANSCWFPSAEG